MGETGTTTYKGVSITEAVYEITSMVEHTRPRSYTLAQVKAVAVELYGERAWWLREAVLASCDELRIEY